MQISVNNFSKYVYLRSLKEAAREQNLTGLARKLEQIVPDISDQYSTFKLDNEYLRTKVRNVHAFQMSLVAEVAEEFKNMVIVDIGDSSGTHLQYLSGLYDKNIKCLSVNLDPKAVEKIRNKGLEAVLARAENLPDYDINPDIFLCFETLEHLMDPCHFLHELSSKTSAKYMIITVPYVRKSRIGLYHILQGRKDTVNAENTHIFELDPDDWKLLMRHSGWEIVREKIYLQYPIWSILYLTKSMWRKYDFEGFYGVILRRDETWSKRYLDW